MTTVPFLLLDIPDLAYPDRWDRRLNTCDSPAALAEELRPHRTDLHARRYLQAVLASGDPLRLQEAMAELEPRRHKGLEGVWNAALVRLGLYPQVLEAPRAPGIGTQPLELENMMDDQVALTTALTEMGQHDRAIKHLHAATMLARALNMLYRLQWCRIETGRANTLRGEPDSAELEDALSMLPLSKRRQGWGRQTLAESYMSEGDYAVAWTSVMDVPFHAADDIGLFLCALLRIPLYRKETETAQGSYAPLARAVWAIRDGQSINVKDLKTTQDEPVASYAEMLRGIVMCRNANTRAQGAMVLRQATHRKLTPDQRALVFLALAPTVAVMGLSESSLAFADSRAAIARLRTQHHLIEFICDIAPEWVALSALAPGAHPMFSTFLTSMPLLTGSHLQIGSDVHKLPGRAVGGVQLVLAGFQGKPQRLQDGAQQRYARALEGLNVKYVVNVGALLRSMLNIGLTLPVHKRRGWVASFRSALDLLDSRSVRQTILNTSMVGDFLGTANSLNEVGG